MTEQKLLGEVASLVSRCSEWGSAETAFRIVVFLKQAGYVQLSGGQSLPEQPTWCSLDGKAIRGAVSVYQIAQQDMIKGGFRKVEL